MPLVKQTSGNYYQLVYLYSALVQLLSTLIVDEDITLVTFAIYVYVFV